MDVSFMNIDCYPWMQTNLKSEKMKTGIDIAIDFDGTCVTHAFPEIGKDIGSVPVLKRLVESGHRLILYTMRSNCEGNTGASKEFPTIIEGLFLDHAVKWFEDNGIKLHAHQTNPNQKAWTTSPKCYAQLYIDDAALGAPLKRDPELSDRPFIDWNAVELILELDGILPPQSEFGELFKAIHEDMKENNQDREIDRLQNS